MPRGVPSNGPRSTGYKTEGGRVSIITHAVTNGSRCWTPVLPTESEKEWQKRLDGIRASLNPSGYLEEQLARQVALTFQQWDRLHRHEKIKTVHEMREFLRDPFTEPGEHSEAALALLETGVGATREQLNRVTRLQTLLEFMPLADPQKSIADSDARLILESAISLCTKAANGAVPFNEQQQTWTWGAVISGLAELASDCRKSPESLYEGLCSFAQIERQRLGAMLKEGLAILERRLVHNGTALTNEYHSKVLARCRDFLRSTVRRRLHGSGSTLCSLTLSPEAQVGTEKSRDLQPNEVIDPDDSTATEPLRCALLLPPPAQSEAWWAALISGRENDAVSCLADAFLVLAHVAFRLGVARAIVGLSHHAITVERLHETICDRYGNAEWRAFTACWYEAAGIKQPERKSSQTPCSLGNVGGQPDGSKRDNPLRARIPPPPSSACLLEEGLHRALPSMPPLVAAFLFHSPKDPPAWRQKESESERSQREQLERIGGWPGA